MTIPFDTKGLESFEDRLDLPYTGKCSYDKCQLENEEAGTVWLNGIPFRFHPQCQTLWNREMLEGKPQESESISEISEK